METLTKVDTLRGEYFALLSAQEEKWMETLPYLLDGNEPPKSLVQELVDVNNRIAGVELQFRRRKDKTLDYILEQGVAKYRKLMENKPWKPTKQRQ